MSAPSDAAPVGGRAVGPNFLGIGVPRGGSTWLHELLDQHPDVWLPSEKRKELHYFDILYGRKDDAWYRAIFAGAHAAGIPAVGEVTPTYFATPEGARRIRDSLPDLHRLLLIVREPAIRMWSEYNWNCRHDNYQGPIEQFLRDKPDFAQRSHYGTSMEWLLEVFTREELLVVVAEEAFADPVGTRTVVAEFLGIDPARFPDAAGTYQVNEGGMPRFRRAYSLASRVRRAASWADLDALTNFARRLGLKKLLLAGSSAGTPDPTPEAAAMLDERYADDRRAMEEYLGRPITRWVPLSERLAKAAETPE